MISEQVVSLSAANWAAEVEGASVPVLVDVTATWCPPCRLLAPIIGELAGEYSGTMKVGALDADANEALVARFGVLGLPTLLLFKGGQPVERIVGYAPKGELKKRIDSVLRQR